MSTNQPTNKALDWGVTIIGALAIVLLAGALVVANFFPKVPFTVVTGMRYAGFVAIALFIIGSAIQNKDFLKDMAGRRSTQHGANSLVLTVAVLAIIGLLNWFGTRYHHRADLTTNKQFSLSPQSKQIAKNLKNDLKLTAFVQTGDMQGRQLKDLMTEYGYVTDHLKLEIIDPSREPGKVKMFLQAHSEFRPRVNALIIDNNGRLTEAQSVSEQDITAAILKSTQDKQFNVYYLKGHGEADFEGFQQDGMSQAKQALEKQNYKVQKLSLFETKNTVPADCDVLIVAGPHQPLLPQEIKAIETYVQKGGKLFALMNPGNNSGLEKVLADYGVQAENDLVVDPRTNTGDLAVPAVQTYPSHAITQGLGTTVYPAARSLTVGAKTPAGVTVTSLAESSDLSFSKRNLKDRSAQFNAAVDKKGPLKLALAITTQASGSAKAARVMAVGNTQFAANMFAQLNPPNMDFFLNSVNWLAEQDTLISIPPKNNDQRTVSVTNTQQAVLNWTVAGAPMAMLLAGGMVWWRRRRS